MKLNLSLLFLFSLAFVSAQRSIYILPQNKTDLEKNELKGNVKYVKIKEWEMVVKFGDPVKDICTSTEEIYFKKDGSYQEKSYAYENGDAKRTKKYTYNKNNQLIEIKVSYVEGNKIEIQENLYNAKNQLTEINFYYDRSKLYGKDKYSYDNNQLKSISKYTGDGNLDEKKAFQWNEYSKMLSELTYNKKEEPQTTKNFEYDATRKLIWQNEEVNFSGTFTEMVQTNFIYNSKNQLTSEMQKFSSSGSSLQIFYTYDSYGNVIKEEEKSGTTGKTKIANQYTYTYDSNGNWLTKLSEDDDKDYALIEREIKYY